MKTRLALCVATTVLAAAGLIVPAQPASASAWDVLGGQPLVISNPPTGQVVNVSGRSTADTAAIQTWPFIGWSAQNWRFWPRNGFFYIAAQHSGKCLDVQWGSTQPGAPVWQWPCNYGSAQMWTVDTLGTDTFGSPTIRLRNQGSGLCLTIPSIAAPQGAQLIQQPCDGGAAQQWQLTQPIVNPASSVVFTTGTLQEFHYFTTRPFNAAPAQNFQLQYANISDSDGSPGYRFLGGASGGCMRPAILSSIPFGIGPGSRLTMSTCPASTADVWFIRQVSRDQLGAPMWSIYHAPTRLCIDMNGSLTPSQSYVQLWPCHNGWNQLWHFL